MGLKKRYYKFTYLIKPSKIMFFRFLLEEHDGIAQMTTLDSKKGIVEVNVPAGFLDDFNELVRWCGESLGLFVLKSHQMDE